MAVVRVVGCGFCVSCAVRGMLANGDAMKTCFQSNGVTPMSIYVLDCIMPKIKGNAWKVLCLIFRETGGSYNIAAQISFSQIREKTGISSSSTVNDALKKLISEKYISVKRQEIDPYEVAARVQDKTPQCITGGVLCNWCQGETLRLHSHHFPIPAKDNGKEIVMICANCHDEYHYLVDRISYSLGEALLETRKE